jgi:hypothetical protein
VSNQESPQPASLGQQRAKHLLRDLASVPFVALVFDDDNVRVYAKGIDEQGMSQVEAMLEGMGASEV